MTRHAEPITPAAGRRVSNEPEQAHEREEGLAGDLARAKCPVDVERGEPLRRRGQAEARVRAVDLDPDEGIQEREGPGDVPARAQPLVRSADRIEWQGCGSELGGSLTRARRLRSFLGRRAVRDWGRPRRGW